jgi:hypothetical protein
MALFMNLMTPLLEIRSNKALLTRDVVGWINCRQNKIFQST